jgi:protein MpaA
VTFLNRIDPDVVVSLHQPFGVVDTSVSKHRALARALSHELQLPRRDVDCGGPCHGTLTRWFNRKHHGEAITVEFTGHPGRSYLLHTAKRGLLAALGGRLV